MSDDKPRWLRECQRCGSALDSNTLCTDQTCPFSDHYQTCPVGWCGHPVHDTIPADMRSQDYCICSLAHLGGKSTNATEAISEIEQMGLALERDEEEDEPSRCSLIIMEDIQARTCWMDKTLLGLVSEFLNEKGLQNEVEQFLTIKEDEERSMTGEANG